MWGKLIASQIFGFVASYVSSEIYSNLFTTPAPFIVPLTAWLITSIIVIIKL